jgi:hypothetical protein
MRLASTSICFLALMLGSASAVEQPLWATVGDWGIYVDTTLGNGCFILASYTRGDLIRIGIDNRNKNGYVMIANVAWQSIEVGKEYKLTFEFNDEPPWTGVFRALKLGELTLLSNYFNDSNFLKDFGAKQTLTIYYDGKFVTTLPLTGSFAAMQSLIDCQTKVDARAIAPPTNSDPFSGGGTRPASDPFSR